MEISSKPKCIEVSGKEASLLKRAFSDVVRGVVSKTSLESAKPRRRN